ncbi:hypothetical protein GYMLUDRAFT_376873 [Collybiopsis luxurians FD-317 M1]|uniref:Uncharacterized protein n=1 Tax=Collybiopsis luxurians FD-317 M1 TaxID=944289 RepID=A0A0D0BBY7_9AGAR|nr:hypothetical protein GYMLUDRAFT_376873 [Collybiopsis luxurians FD-317 M1]
MLLFLYPLLWFEILLIIPFTFLYCPDSPFSMTFHQTLDWHLHLPHESPFPHSCQHLLVFQLCHTTTALSEVCPSHQQKMSYHARTSIQIVTRCEVGTPQNPSY